MARFGLVWSGLDGSGWVWAKASTTQVFAKQVFAAQCTSVCCTIICHKSVWSTIVCLTIVCSTKFSVGFGGDCGGVLAVVFAAIVFAALVLAAISFDAIMSTAILFSATVFVWAAHGVWAGLGRSGRVRAGKSG